MGRCAVLIDGAFLDKVLENDFGRVRVDIGKLGDTLAGPSERLRTYYYLLSLHALYEQSAR